MYPSQINKVGGGVTASIKDQDLFMVLIMSSENSFKFWTLNQGLWGFLLLNYTICVNPKHFLQSATKTSYHFWLNAEVTMRKHLSSIKSLTLKMKNNDKNIFLKYNYSPFKKVMLCVLAGFVNVILKSANKFLSFNFKCCKSQHNPYKQYLLRTVNLWALSLRMT